MTAIELLSIACHVGVLISRIVLFGATAWALIYTRPARISFLAHLPRPLQPPVGDLFGTAWAYAIVMLLGGFGAVSQYLPPWAALAFPAFNAGIGLAVGVHVMRLAARLPSYIRGLP